MPRLPVMTPARRWSVVAVVVLVLIGVPILVRQWPVADSDVSAAALLTQVDAAHAHPYSGFVETTGTLSLPSTNSTSDLGSLFGGELRLRVWWRDADDWRVDQLATAGETDLVHRGEGILRFDYADNSASFDRDQGIRLPRTADLTPAALGRTVLSGVDADDVRRLPSRRVAGIAAPGLRVDPAQPQSSIDHVDLWADPASGVPLRLEVYAKGATNPAFTTTFDSFSAATPPAQRVAFQPPAAVQLDHGFTPDIADFADHFFGIDAGTRLAGLARSDDTHSSAGVFGSGLTRFIEVPLRDREADPLRTSLTAAPGAKISVLGQPATGTSRYATVPATIARFGPLGVLETGTDGDHFAYLIAGTVTDATLREAARELEAVASLTPVHSGASGSGTSFETGN